MADLCYSRVRYCFILIFITLFTDSEQAETDQLITTFRQRLRTCPIYHYGLGTLLVVLLRIRDKRSPAVVLAEAVPTSVDRAYLAYPFGNGDEMLGNPSGMDTAKQAIPLILNIRRCYNGHESCSKCHCC